jgi:hypothetical protein
MLERGALVAAGRAPGTSTELVALDVLGPQRMTGTVQAIVRAPRTVQHGWDSLSSKHLCPGCGRPMGLTRTVPATPGYSELRTYGCKECGGREQPKR